MPEFRRAGRTPINIFEIEGTYLFKHFFEEEDVFRELRRYYSDYDYRFEVPPDRFEHVRSILEEHGFGPVVVETIEPFTVVKRKYTDHPRMLFKESVFHRSVGNFNAFVMTHAEAVERAVGAGAQRIDETDLELPV